MTRAPAPLTIVRPGEGRAGALGSIVTRGAIGFRSGDREVVLEAGGYIGLPPQ